MDEGVKGGEKMSENGKLTYTQALELVLDRLRQHDKRIDSIDERERLIQKALERLAGEKTGKKEAKKEHRADWKLILTTIGVIASIAIGVAGLIW